MKDSEGRVLYVGKAKDLKKRVAMYFKPDYQHSYRTRVMVSLIADVECIQTDTELEALILESTLIKQLMPKYNIMLKDDKSYAYVKIDTREDFPKIQLLREHTLEHTGKEHGAVKYFGPKLASGRVSETLTILKKLFPYKHCNLSIKWNGTEQDAKTLSITPDHKAVTVTNRVIDFPCLDYHIKRCPGPCIGAVTPEDYAKTIKSVVDFFSGKSDEVIGEIETQMKKAASEKRFEQAAKLRDKLEQFNSLLEKQKMSDQNRVDSDVIHGTSLMGNLYYSILLIRKGKIIDQQQFVFNAVDVGQSDGVIESINEMEFFESFLKQYYERSTEIPKEVIIPVGLDDADIVETWLTKLRGEKVRILVPQKGEKNQLLELALKNATSFAKQHRIKWLAEKQHEQALSLLAQTLKLPKEKPLNRIEGYDISHLAGNETVGSMVVFNKGKADTTNYRHFKLRTSVVQGTPNDFKSMEEVLTRRFKYLAMQERKKGLKIKKATKKHRTELKIESEGLWIAELDKKIVAHCTVQLIDGKLPTITSLWVDPSTSEELVGFALIEKAIAKLKQKKIYIIADKKQEDFYATFGAISLLKTPEKIAEYCSENKLKNPLLLVYEVYKRAKIDPSFSAKPDLILIDGGKGQLGVAVEVLKKLDIHIPLISLAKKLEEIFVPGQSAPILLAENSEALRLLQHIRDESHRFAITFQRKLHVKGMYN